MEDHRIQDLVGTVYQQGEGGKWSTVCWNFCRDIKKPEIILPEEYAGELFSKVDQPVKGDIVLFRYGGLWHSGIVWPDGLHFIHAISELWEGKEKFVIRVDRLTGNPWKLILEGYYHYESKSIHVAVV